ncbi:MAG: hypothetical protein UR27_C0001G0082 [Candidatus Peregrinibacteria bacterium GW2011_GWA2_33_10]|nr:MAG: hypothetical protein UR27_C0001G0082 [Candidatus Peregrinibacteria bacterium GW2011_GWA2_33_10]KKP39810.1 MAG: hypothetical protein UR30_C0008G0079 [Candidatus Peregrinibacteria bacterium GW2011_GWC2_33_13]OGJ50881.1 MAG: hypothetical protein A2229_04965 [Candidatus Peregrinibacteria bacterium RIFOXYA2_FULL_33_7]
MTFKEGLNLYPENPDNIKSNAKGEWQKLATAIDGSMLSSPKEQRKIDIKKRHLEFMKPKVDFSKIEALKKQLGLSDTEISKDKRQGIVKENVAHLYHENVVLGIQKLLNDAGLYEGDINGKYDKDFRRFVRGVQLKLGIKNPDGWFGKETLQSVINHIEKNTLKPKEKTDDPETTMNLARTEETLTESTDLAKEAKKVYDDLQPNYTALNAHLNFFLNQNDTNKAFYSLNEVALEASKVTTKLKDVKNKDILKKLKEEIKKTDDPVNAIIVATIENLIVDNIKHNTTQITLLNDVLMINPVVKNKIQKLLQEDILSEIKRLLGAKEYKDLDGNSYFIEKNMGSSEISTAIINGQLHINYKMKYPITKVEKTKNSDLITTGNFATAETLIDFTHNNEMTQIKSKEVKTEIIPSATKKTKIDDRTTKEAMQSDINASILENLQVK